MLLSIGYREMRIRQVRGDDACGYLWASQFRTTSWPRFHWKTRRRHVLPEPTFPVKLHSTSPQCWARQEFPCNGFVVKQVENIGLHLVCSGHCSRTSLRCFEFLTSGSSFVFQLTTTVSPFDDYGDGILHSQVLRSWQCDVDTVERCI